MTFIEILEYNFIDIAGYKLNLLEVSIAVAIIVSVRLILWVVDKFILEGYFKKHNRIDLGRRFALKQFIKYVLYVLATLAILETLGVQFSALWASAAALLVGAGLGLQQAVSDLFSGVVLLSEGTVEVGDIVVVEGIVGRVTKIGIRTSKVLTRDSFVIIIPNSKLVMNNVINWSNNQEPSRFEIPVGVSYGSDVELVTRLLLQAAEEHKSVLKMPKPTVQFMDFGNSSLDFRLLFYSQEMMRVENVKSEVRYNIVRLFRENNVEIPFPQRDLWFRNPETFQPPKHTDKQDTGH